MWLKKAIEKRHVKYIQEAYSRTDKRFMLREGVKAFQSYVHPLAFHVVGYVSNTYNINGKTFVELKTKRGDTLTITAPKYTSVKSMEFQSVLCLDVLEHYDCVVDNSVHTRTCSKVIIL